MFTVIEAKCLKDRHQKLGTCPFQFMLPIFPQCFHLNTEEPEIPQFLDNISKITMIRLRKGYYINKSGKMAYGISLLM